MSDTVVKTITVTIKDVVDAIDELKRKVGLSKKRKKLLGYDENSGRFIYPSTIYNILKRDMK